MTKDNNRLDVELAITRLGVPTDYSGVSDEVERVVLETFAACEVPVRGYCNYGSTQRSTHFDGDVDLDILVKVGERTTPDQVEQCMKALHAGFDRELSFDLEKDAPWLLWRSGPGTVAGVPVKGVDLNVSSKTRSNVFIGPLLHVVLNDRLTASARTTARLLKRILKTSPILEEFRDKLWKSVQVEQVVVSIIGDLSGNNIEIFDHVMAAFQRGGPIDRTNIIEAVKSRDTSGELPSKYGRYPDLWALLSSAGQRDLEVMGASYASSEDFAADYLTKIV